MARTLKNLFGLIKEKTVPPISAINEYTREGLPKAYIPKFLYKPPFGYPRFVDLPNVRRLASTPYVEMCMMAIIDEISSVPWDIVVKEGVEYKPEYEKEVEHVKQFYENPNTNKESFNEIRRKYIRDILEIDAGVIIKVFNLKEEMVEMVARDGATFTKNPDIFGMFTDREDIIHDSYIATTNKEFRLMEPGWITAADARERAAYFQYGWITGARPVPFGRREMIWFERNPRTDSIYGRSPVEILANTIQTLIYAIEHNLEYFNDNSIPKGIIGLEGSDTDEIKAFRDQWIEQQRKRDSAGNWKKIFHHVPIVGTKPTFERIQFSNAELELLEGQKWWAKMVWACFGVTAVELGYTEDAKGLANQIVQSNVFRKRAINPILRIEEYKHNHEILSEFYITEKRKFIEQEIDNQVEKLKLKGEVEQKALEEIELKAKEKADKKEKAKQLPYQNIEFKFLMFDVEEETKKASLYKLQLDAGYKTVNEVRKNEGIDDIEGGDELHKKQSMPFGNSFAQEQEEREKETRPGSRTEEEKPEKEKKAFNGTESVESSKIKEKSLQAEDNPLIPKENERMDSDKLERSIVYVLRENERKIKKIVETEIGKNKLIEIKGVDDIAKEINRLTSFQGLKTVSDAVIKNTFIGGWDDAEKQLNKNLMVNQNALNYIQDYTFNNIKGMTEDIAKNLRAELERAIMQGEGIVKIKDRISKVFDVGENRAEMIARTETNRAENQGKLQAFKSSGEKYQKRWISTIDGRTSPICRRLNGKVVKMDENFKDKTSGWEGPCPPSHVDCRSAVIFTLKGESEQESKSGFIEKYKEARQGIIEEEAREKFDSKNREKEKEKLDLKLKEEEIENQKSKKALLNKLERDRNGRD